jgi:hypothetical protein
VEPVLGIDVDASLWDSWWSWLAPATQPFVVDKKTAASLPQCPPSVDPQLGHTFMFWRVDRRDGVAVWLDEESFAELPRATRAALVREQVVRRRGAVPSVRTWNDLVDPAVLRANGDGHRFVWWPSMATGAPRDAVVRRAVEHDQSPSRHGEVAAATWKATASKLPNVRDLAGTFPARGEHNCFGTVMAAAGDHDPGDTWIEREPIEQWLAERTTPARRRDDASVGTVLVWRNTSGDIDHTAVTIGDGWAFEKASQDWWRPRVVLAVDDLIRDKRSPGYRLERRALR